MPGNTRNCREGAFTDIAACKANKLYIARQIDQTFASSFEYRRDEFGEKEWTERIANNFYVHVHELQDDILIKNLTHPLGHIYTTCGEKRKNAELLIAAIKKLQWPQTDKLVIFME